MKINNIALAISLAAGLSSHAGTVVVSPANMNGWSFEQMDNNGNIATSAPYTDAIGQMVTGPGAPPLGIGSAQLATGAGGGDGASELSIATYDGTKLSSITSLGYSTYDVANNGQQFPYLQIAVSTDGTGSLASEDTLFFEPPYQTPGTGGPGVPNQGNTQMNTWQSWNAVIGGWWDNGLAPGYNPVLGGGGYDEVGSLATFESLYPDATIMDNPYPGNGDGGISLTVGYASAGDNFDAYVDAVTINSTTYNFEPGTAPDNSGTIGLSFIALAAVAGFGQISRRPRLAR